MILFNDVTYITIYDYYKFYCEEENFRVSSRRIFKADLVDLYLGNGLTNINSKCVKYIKKLKRFKG